MMPHNTQVNPDRTLENFDVCKAGSSRGRGAPATNVDVPGGADQTNASTKAGTNEMTGVEAPAPGSSESTNPVKK